jgi:phosphohistidine phosphatase
MSHLQLLLVVRHGKAERDSLTGRDEDRVLRPRGVRQAQFLGNKLMEMPAESKPQVILASPVIRAADTARIIAQFAGVPLEFHPELSTSSDHHAVLELLHERDRAGNHRRLMVVGHNPTLEELVSTLCRGGAGLAGGMRTGMAAVLELEKGLTRAKLQSVLREDWDDE